MKKYERVLKALANVRRLEIIKFLKKGKEANVEDMANHLKLSYKSTSKHLGILFAADILEKEQRTFSMFYSIRTNLPRIARAVINLI